MCTMDGSARTSSIKLAMINERFQIGKEKISYIVFVVNMKVKCVQNIS